MVYCIDIDGTLCQIAPDVMTYGHEIPHVDRIEKVNALYNGGHTIILWTGRHWNHLHITLAQLSRWGLKYHTLIMSKPVADIYIDDKAIDDISFFERQRD